MARKQESRTKGFDRLRGAASALKRMFTRGDGAAELDDSDRSMSTQSTSRGGNRHTAQAPARTTRREADIPLDVIDRAYTPSDTSSKTSFRSNGADHQKDQEFALGVADDRWNDEDRITNKSGDPRIGTHRRTYEPAEARTESRE
ncbi:MAG TPA: hypothetical protein VEK79_08605 [Thermoanaerobaculia bacterium]|nr:hypothetical protein [Thermoanaerobaculia bacterium]